MHPSGGIVSAASVQQNLPVNIISQLDLETNNINNKFEKNHNISNKYEKILTSSKVFGSKPLIEESTTYHLNISVTYLSFNILVYLCGIT